MFEKDVRIVSPETVEAVRARDVYCQFCGVSNPDVHHIRHKGASGDDTQDNLIGLCRTCHSKVHSGEIQVADLRATLKRKYGLG